MPIDTREKRQSLLDWGAGPVAVPHTTGSLDQGDRQHFLDLYSGLLAAELQPPTVRPGPRDRYAAPAYARDRYAETSTARDRY